MILVGHNIKSTKITLTAIVVGHNIKSRLQITPPPAIESTKIIEWPYPQNHNGRTGHVHI